MWGAAANAPKHIWKEFGKSAGLGIGGALIGFAIDQGANKWEKSYEDETGKNIKIFNSKDENNNIAVIATNTK